MPATARVQPPPPLSVAGSDDTARKATRPIAGHAHHARPPRHRRVPAAPEPAPSPQRLALLEQGWNDRFFRSTPPARARGSSPLSERMVDTEEAKTRKMREERVQYGRNDERNRRREHSRLANRRLDPIAAAPHPPRERAESLTKEDKLRFKALKAIDAREALLYQLNALILCTPVIDALASRPREGVSALNASGPLSGRRTIRNPVSRSDAAVNNPREATKLAQQLGADLQLSGIQCVEAVVEWMLEAGAKAPAPPPFLWRGRSYFSKMQEDLDFASAELRVRGVEVDCFSEHNPLCVRPGQKLGRVLAAHSIVEDMVAKEAQAVNVSAHEPNATPAPHRGKMKPKKPVPSAISRPEPPPSPAQPSSPLSPPVEPLTGRSVEEQSADVMIAQQDDEQDEYEQDNGMGADELDGDDDRYEPSPNAARSDTRDGNEGFVQVTARSDVEVQNESDHVEDSQRSEEEQEQEQDQEDEYHKQEHDQEAESQGKEQEQEEEHQERDQAQEEKSQEQEEEEEAHSQDQEDEEEQDQRGSEQEQETRLEPEQEQEQEQEQTNEGNNEALDATHNELMSMLDESVHLPPVDIPSTAVVDSSDDDAYEGSFDAETSRTTPPSPRPSDIPVETQDGEDPAILRNHSSSDALDESGLFKPTASTTESEQVPDSQEEEEHQEDNARDTNTNLNDSGTSVSSPTSSEPFALPTDWWQMIERELAEWPLSRPNFAPSLPSCASWSELSALRKSLEDHTSIDDAMKDSLLSSLGLCVCADPPTTALAALLATASAQLLHLHTALWAECICVLDSVTSDLNRRLEAALNQAGTQSSEVDFDEAMDLLRTCTEAVRPAARWTLGAAGVASLLRAIDASKCIASTSALARLVRAISPYLLSQPRERWSTHWHRVEDQVGEVGLHLHQLMYLLDGTSKCLLLNISRLAHSVEESADDMNETIPKLAIVCDRSNVLASSVEHVFAKCLSHPDPLPPFQLFPFFLSDYGEKQVDGMRVEEGEGKGPLKEWFALVSSTAANQWRRVDLSRFSRGNDAGMVQVDSNRLVVNGLEESLVAGCRVEWPDAESETVSRVINAIEPNGVYRLDRSVLSMTFPTSELQVFAPQQTFFDYIRSTECYWLNERTADTPYHRQVLEFLGWLVANALLHSCALSVRIHTLFFDLLLDSNRIVGPDDVLALDPTLHSALMHVKTMKASELADVLEFEGRPTTLSADEYIADSIDQKFGRSSPLWWQLEQARRGFARVYSHALLHSVQLTGRDIQETLGGGSACADTADFSIRRVFRVSTDAEFSSCKPLARTFWRIVDELSPVEKRKLLKFITGIDTLPIEGTEFLRIEMPFPARTPAEQQRTLLMLPQAHTCDNTLELPHYWHALCARSGHDDSIDNDALEAELGALLTSKLRLAMEDAGGYGLDGTSAAMLAQVLSHDAPDADGDPDAAAAQDSFESLELPQLNEDGGAAVAPAALESAGSEPAQEESEPAPESSEPAAEQSEPAPTEPAPTPSESESVEQEPSESEPAEPEPAESEPHEQTYGENDWETEEL